MTTLFVSDGWQALFGGQTIGTGATQSEVIGRAAMWLNEHPELWRA
jgi:hypothetical protein